MHRSKGLALAATLAVLVAIGGGIYLAGRSRPPDAERAKRPRAPDARHVPSYAASCANRVEGPAPAAAEDDTTRIGPVRLPFIAANLRDLTKGDVRPPKNTNFPYPFYPVKALALVEAGRTVTLKVPPEQRHYLSIAYGADAMPPTGVSEITLRACHRSQSGAARARECRWQPYRACMGRYTQFAGAIHIDFDHAPERGFCSELIVQQEGRKPIRRHLFAPPPVGSCPPTQS